MTSSRQVVAPFKFSAISRNGKEQKDGERNNKKWEMITRIIGKSQRWCGQDVSRNGISTNGHKGKVPTILQPH